MVGVLSAHVATHVCGSSHYPKYRTKRVIYQSNVLSMKVTYLIGPFLKELSMFLELVAEVLAPPVFPSACFERLKEEFSPPAVD